MSRLLDEDVERVKSAVDCREIFARFWPERVKRHSGAKWMALCPFHDDRNPSFVINKAYAKCFAGCRSPSGNPVYDCFDLVSAATGKSFPESVRFLGDITSIPLEQTTSPPSRIKPPMKKNNGMRTSQPSSHIAATYDYVDESGKLLYQVVRFEPKAFRQRRPDGQGGWIWNLDGVRRVLYRLPEVARSEAVVMCEGEKDVDNLTPYLPPKWVATTVPGGAGKWDPGYTDALCDKEVVIIPDVDNAGMAHLDLLVKELKGAVCSIRVVFLDQMCSPAPVKDISDYLKNLTTDEERLNAVRSLLNSSITVTEEPDESEDEANDPLERIPFPAFPWDSLPPRWLEHFEDLAESLAVAQEGVVSSSLAVLSGAIGNHLQVSPKPGWKSSVAIWMALVGDSGQGKTPIIRNLMQGLYTSQQEAFDAYQSELKAFEENASKKGESSLTPPKLTRYFTTDPTLEALLCLLAENPRGLILVKDELASLVCGFNQYKPGGRGNERQHYLSIFSGSPVIPDRKYAEKVYVPNPCLSLLGGIQRRLVPDILGPEAFSDGLIYRFLFLVLNPQWYPLSRKTWREESRKAWHQLLMAAKSFQEERIVHLDQGAWECFRNYRNQLYRLFGYVPSQVAGFIPKMTDYALRLAGVLHFWHSFPAVPPPTILPREIMEKAIRLSSFYFGQVRLLLQLYKKQKELRLDQKALLSTLLEVQPMVAGGALPTAVLFEKFNSKVPEHIQLSNTRKLTAYLKEIAAAEDIALTFRPMRWRNTFCRCLVWESDKIDKLLKLLPAR
jgi:putative DNA primase/helicase